MTVMRRKPTTPEFWLNAQKAVDIYKTAKEIGKLPRPFGRLAHA